MFFVRSRQHCIPFSLFPPSLPPPLSPFAFIMLASFASRSLLSSVFLERSMRERREEENDNDDENDNSTQEKTQWFSSWNRDITSRNNIDVTCCWRKFFFFIYFNQHSFNMGKIFLRRGRERNGKKNISHVISLQYIKITNNWKILFQIQEHQTMIRSAIVYFLDRNIRVQFNGMRWRIFDISAKNDDVLTGTTAQ